MVVLVTDNVEQVSVLELALVQANIPYNVEVGSARHGIGQPYLLVDGVPLDIERALKWIKEGE